MMKYLLTLSLLMTVLLAQGQDALEIMEKSIAIMQGNSSRAAMTMEIVRPSWTRQVGIKGWSLGTEFSLMLITSPARDKGSATLKRQKEIWSWQPSIDRVIKLPPSMMMQSWMGSDFTNDDLVKESSVVDDYTHKILGDTVIMDREAWKIELIPKEDAAVVWGRIEAYVAKADFVHLRFHYYDEDGYLINTMLLSDIKEIGGRVIPTRMEMIPAENPDQKTVIIYEDLEFDIDISPSFFSIQNMKRVR